MKLEYSELLSCWWNENKSDSILLFSIRINWRNHIARHFKRMAAHTASNDMQDGFFLNTRIMSPCESHDSYGYTQNQWK